MPIADTTPSGSAATQPQANGERADSPAAAKPGKKKPRRLMPFLAVICAVALGGAGAWYWWQLQLQTLPPGIAKANGRLEAEQVEIATKYPGRIAEVLVKEGTLVQKGEVVVHMDIVELTAQLQAAQAEVVTAQHREAEAKAFVAQRASERIFARQELQRFATLHSKGWATGERFDEVQNQMRSADAAYDTAVASVQAATAHIMANQAEVRRLQAQIDDSTLVAPALGRIQYKLAQPGEVLPAGGRVLTLLDLNDVYLTIFLPAREAGPLAIGDEARVVLDPFPRFVFPANITFVATEAQFTPKTVETEEEREKLMFRVKLTIDPSLRNKYVNEVKTGLRGIGYVRTEQDAAWPEKLAVKLP